MLKVPGTQFRFSADPDGIVYTVNACNVKRLYNHTSWRKRYFWNSSYNAPYATNQAQSVEYAAIRWAKEIGSPLEAARASQLQNDY